MEIVNLAVSVTVTVSRYLCELEGLARGILRTGHCCLKRQGSRCVSDLAKDYRSTRTVNMPALQQPCQLRGDCHCLCISHSQPPAWRHAQQLLPARSPELQNSQRQQMFHPRIHPHATIVYNSLLTLTSVSGVRI